MNRVTRFLAHSARCAAVLPLLVVFGCSTPVPSLVDRLPATILDREDWAELEQKWEPRRTEPPIPDEPSDAPREQAMVEADIVGIVPVEEADRVDAILEGSESKYVLQFQQVRVIAGSFSLETFGVAVRSPLEEFAYPISDVKRFILTLDRRSDGRGLYRITAVSPPATELLQKARESRRSDREDTNQDG